MFVVVFFFNLTRLTHHPLLMLKNIFKKIAFFQGLNNVFLVVNIFLHLMIFDLIYWP